MAAMAPIAAVPEAILLGPLSAQSRLAVDRRCAGSASKS
jgi:hypothetical protein